MGDRDPVARFAEIAEQYCAWAEGAPAAAEADSRRALALLLELVRAAMELPNTSPDGPDPADVPDDAWGRVLRRFASLPVQYYGTREVEDIVENEQLIGDLCDDLADIWRDLRGPLDLHRAGHEADACWHWAFGFRFHWGEHAVEAIRVLHAWRSEHAS